MGCCALRRRDLKRERLAGSAGALVLGSRRKARRRAMNVRLAVDEVGEGKAESEVTEAEEEYGGVART
jgi:hypothetical protein